jgi:subtilisin
MVGAPLEWSETMGEDIKIGVIDTGIDANHIDLKNRVRDYVNFSGGNSNDIEDKNGHGTHVAGIICAEKNGVGVVGVAPKADLYVAKAFGSDGKTTYPSIEKCLNWMISKKVDVINMSFSSDISSREYRNLIGKTSASGISMICAAGNEGLQGDDSIGYPANFKETIAVTAVDINKRITDFSSYGGQAEIAAAGKNIYSTYLNNGYATLSGTSMATPIITGAAAILHGKCLIRYGRKLTPTELRLLLNIYTDKLGEKGRDRRYGYGLFTFGRLDGDDYVYSMPASVTENLIGYTQKDKFRCAYDLMMKLK